jgi:hypothetical protein
MTFEEAEEIAARLVTQRTWDVAPGLSGGRWTAEIAKAIHAATLAAITAEREACAGVAEDFVPELLAMVAAAGWSLLGHHGMIERCYQPDSASAILAADEWLRSREGKGNG